MVKLSKHHINSLYQFTRQHYVIHYDLQTELVDHLANDIETIWESHPNLSFEQARDVSFKKFGIFGFMDVVSARQKAMSKRYFKLLWSFAKEWFTLPKLIKTSLCFAICYVVFSSIYGKYLAISAFTIIIILTFIKSFKFKKYIKKKEKPTEKLWLLEELIFKNASTNTLLLLSLVINSYNTLDVFWKYAQTSLGAAILFTLFSIYSYVSVVVLPNKSEELLKKTYPEFSL